MEMNPTTTAPRNQAAVDRLLFLRIYSQSTPWSQIQGQAIIVSIISDPVAGKRMIFSVQPEA